MQGLYLHTNRTRSIFGPFEADFTSPPDFIFSERASETNNAGQKLRDGANINRSLLALANCINALGKQGKKGLSYVPYRNRSVSRLSKFPLSLSLSSAVYMQGKSDSKRRG
jgi:hypothetical protein